MKVLINGISSNSAGGKSVLLNFLRNVVSDDKNSINYIVICINETSKELPKGKNVIEIIKDNSYIHPIRLARYYSYDIHKYINRNKISVLINFADFIIPVKCKQIYYFDWAYAVYPESVVWKRMPITSWIKRKLKVLNIRMFIKKMDLVVAQTSIIEKRLRNQYSICNTKVIPNELSIDHLKGGSPFDFKLPISKKKLLFLSKYYDHKNFEIVMELALLTQKEKLNYCIVITISETDGAKAQKFINKIKLNELENVIVNLGTVEMKHLPSLFDQIDVLLMPSHLESFSGTYLEAMYQKKPIIASDYDFARIVCQSAGTYFDPFDVNDLASKISEVLKKSIEIENKIINGQIILEKYLSKNLSYNSLIQALNELHNS